MFMTCCFSFFRRAGRVAKGRLRDGDQQQVQPPAYALNSVMKAPSGADPQIRAGRHVRLLNRVFDRAAATYI
jgi:hypothetical protein